MNKVEYLLADKDNLSLIAIFKALDIVNIKQFKKLLKSDDIDAWNLFNNLIEAHERLMLKYPVLWNKLKNLGRLVNLPFADDTAPAEIVERDKIKFDIQVVGEPVEGGETILLDNGRLVGVDRTIHMEL